jgi:hypothetical protein
VERFARPVCISTNLPQIFHLAFTIPSSHWGQNRDTTRARKKGHQTAIGNFKAIVNIDV